MSGCRKVANAKRVDVGYSFSTFRQNRISSAGSPWHEHQENFIALRVNGSQEHAMRQPKTRRLFLEQLESRIALNSYFVSPTGNDNNAGTSLAPWLTLQHAADQVVAGDSVTVRAGT